MKNTYIVLYITNKNPLGKESVFTNKAKALNKVRSLPGFLRLRKFYSNDKKKCMHIYKVSKWVLKNETK